MCSEDGWDPGQRAWAETRDQRAWAHDTVGAVVQGLTRAHSEPRGRQHARSSCPSPSPGACSSSHPLSWRCRLTISPSVVPFSFGLQSFPASGSFPMSLLFTSSGQNIGASASASVLPMHAVNSVKQGFFLLDLKLSLCKHVCAWTRGLP